jgi:carbonic anhydrase
MRLFEAILDANHRALSGDARAGLRLEEHSAALPVVALTCIDPRLNPLMPEVLGIPEEHFIWLRNAGNIITGPTSSTMRSLALACAVKGGKEIVVIGHTDCLVCKTPALQLTDRFAELGIPRSKLPDNLQEFFGLFASERQNVLRAADFIRQSPLIGPKIPVHGLLVDISNGRLESIVNGYQTLESVVSRDHAALREEFQPIRGFDQIGDFKIAEMKLPEVKIGDAAIPSRPEVMRASATAPLAPSEAGRESSEPVTTSHGDQLGMRFDPAAVFKIVGTDRKIYGPYTADELEHWINEGRIALDALAQRVGFKEWKQIKEFVREKAGHIPVPPRLSSLKMRKPNRHS